MLARLREALRVRLRYRSSVTAAASCSFLCGWVPLLVAGLCLVDLLPAVVDSEIAPADVGSPSFDELFL